MARKAHNIHYIYKTTCNVTGRWYVGMHSTSNENDGYMGSGTVLRRSIRKYGEDNHIKEILEYCDSRELLIEAEILAITDDMVLDKNCMNLKQGGDGGFSSEEHRIKFITEGVRNGRKKTDEFLKDKYGENWLSSFNSYVSKKAWENQDYRDNKLKNLDWTNKNHTEETKKLMSEQRKGQGTGEANSQYGTCWIMKDGLNKKIKKEDFPVYLLEGWDKGRK